MRYEIIDLRPLMRHSVSKVFLNHDGFYRPILGELTLMLNPGICIKRKSGIRPNADECARFLIVDFLKCCIFWPKGQFFLGIKLAIGFVLNHVV